jgi:Protein of unknown function (DUF998)
MTHNRAHPLKTLLLAGGVVGGVGFLAVALAAGAFRRDYSALHQPVSLLSVGPDGWVQIANFVVTRVLMVGCGVGLRRALAHGRGATWVPLLIVLYGFGLVGAGMFSAEPRMEAHVFDAGHFLLETHAGPAVAFMVDFIRRTQLARGTARD